MNVCILMGSPRVNARALLDYGFKQMNLEEIVAIVKPENIASKKVIENMGLKYQYTLEGLPKEFDWNNGELLYSLTKSEYMKEAGNDKGFTQ